MNSNNTKINGVPFDSCLKIYSSPGGGRFGNDTARCYLDSAGQLSAYNKDSGMPRAVWGPAITRGCSEAEVSPEYIVKRCSDAGRGTPVRVFYSFSMKNDKTVLLQQGESYEIYRSPGKVAYGSDIARCYLSRAGDTVRAFNKDSGAEHAEWGPEGRCSQAKWGTFLVRCCLD
jgi:hypothetical protein